MTYTRLYFLHISIRAAQVSKIYRTDVLRTFKTGHRPNVSKQTSVPHGNKLQSGVLAS